MKRSLLLIALFGVIATAGSLFASATPAHALTGLPSTFSSPFGLHGYAWSSNIGWVSFNSEGGSVPYAVTVSTPTPSNPSYGSGTATLSGYAWSDNIGWIKFGGLTGCPGGGSCAATLNLSNNELTGWARACNGTAPGDCSSMTNSVNGWDGWISLNCTNTGGCGTSAYRIKAVPSGSQGLFDSSSYAWGSDVVGWVAFQTAYSKVYFNPPCPYSRQCTADSLGVTINNMWCQSTTTQCTAGNTCSNTSGVAQCSTPTLTGKLSVSPTYTHQGGTVTLDWNMAVSAKDCYVTQNNATTTNSVGKQVGNKVPSDPINDHTTTFRLFCQPKGGGAYTLVDSELVQLLPTIREN